MIRPWYRSRVFWLALLGLAFFGTSWVMSMRSTRGVSWRWGDRAVFLATSDGSVRLGYEGRATREIGFEQWAIPRGEYSNSTEGDGWFVAPGIERDADYESWIMVLPHWGLVTLWAGVLGVVVLGGRRFRRQENPEAAL